MSRQLATGAGVTVGATLLMGGAAQAAAFTVGTTADTEGATDCAVATNTDCTLRDAIEDANGASGSTITFRSGLSGTIQLTAALPGIYHPTTITGPGPGQITVSGEHAFRVFFATTALGDNVSISGLTVASAASAGPGAGVYSKSADLTLRDTVVTGNDSEASGGGVAAYTGGSLTIEDSTISDNTGTRGAGVYTAQGDGVPATVRNSTITRNRGSDYGGGLYFDYSAAATLENSTVYDNEASHDGGGVFHYGQKPPGPGLIITGSTITHNDATMYGGGVSGRGNPDYAQPTIRDSIVSANTAGDGGPDISAYSATMNVGFSLIGSPDPNTTINTTGPNLIGVDPQLGILRGNGGPTETQKPATTSPVVDAGSAFGLTTDERGLTRPFDAVPANAAGGDGSDIGAVELQSSDIAAAPPPASPTTPATPAPKKKCKKHKKRHKRSAQSAKKCKKKKKKH
jgi:parallel beta helix pectate lyase-like protein